VIAEWDRAEGVCGWRLVDGFHFNEPWDSPNNRKLHNLPAHTLFQCPDDPASGESAETNYVAVVGPGTVFPSDGTSRCLADVTDGPGNSFSLVEVVGAGIHWMEPKELNWGTMSFRLNDPLRPSISSNHPFGKTYYSGPHCLTMKGSVSALPQNIPPETLKAVLTIADGEKVSKKEWSRRP
jgi:hypothetical protein